MSISGLGASQLLPLDRTFDPEELRKAKQGPQYTSFITALKGAEAPRDAANAADFFTGATSGDTSGSASTQTLEKSAEEKFLDFSKMSDVEKLRMKELKEKDLSEEKLNEMEAQARARVEEDIRQKVEETIVQQTGKSIGGIADLTV